MTHKPHLCYLVLVMMFVLGFGIFVPKALALEKVYYIHSDHLGSVTLTTDESGNVASYHTYYPYGSTRGLLENQPRATEHQYTGQISDTDQTGLYYYNARYYDPSTVLFNQADTTSGENRYQYVNSNPMIYSDPTGNTERNTNVLLVTYNPVPESIASRKNWDKFMMHNYNHGANV